MKATLRALDSAIRHLNTAALTVAAICLLTIMVIGSVDAVTLNLLSAPVPAALEASEVLLGVSIFLTFAYAQSRREHINVDLFILRAPPIVRRISLFLTLVVGAALFAVLTWRSGSLAMTSFRIDEYANAIVTFPIYPAKFLIAGGAGIATLEFVRQLVWFFINGAADEPPHGREDVG